MNVHVTQSKPEWSPETCQAEAKARKARLFTAPIRPVAVPVERVLSARERLAEVRYARPIGPRWHTNMYDEPIGPRPRVVINVSSPEFLKTQPFIPLGFQDMGIQEIISYMCELRGTTKEMLFGPQRNWPAVRIRQETMYLISSLGKYSLPEIGRRLGGKDHSTVIHARDKIRGLIAEGKFEPTPFVPEIAIRACSRRIVAPCPTSALVKTYG